MHDVQSYVLITGNTRVILSTIISSLIFLVSVAVYATMIYYEDRKALLYNSNWIRSEEDIDFLQGKCHDPIEARVYRIAGNFGEH